MGQKIEFGSDCRNKMYEGVRKVNDATKVTLGPMGKCVVVSELYQPFYEGMFKPLQLSKDGYRVSRSINLQEPLEHIGQRLIQEAAQKTVDQAGDGTTGTCLLMEAMVREGLILLNEGVNSQDLKRGIDKATEYIVEELRKMAIPVGEDNNKIFQVATVSANNDETIGRIISDAFAKIGKEGVIDLEESKTVDTVIKIADGYKFNRGWISPLFITNKIKQTCEFENPLILLYEKRVTHHTQVERALTIANQLGKPLLIVCEDADEEGLAFIAMNVIQKRVQCCIVKSPSFGEMRREEMEDIAAVTGGYYVCDTKGVTVKDVEQIHFGTAKKVIVSKDETVIIEGGNDKDTFDEIVNELRMNLAQAKTEEEKLPIEKRVARLKGGIAVIQVGAATETEMKEKMDRYDDAVRATKSAIGEGIIVGAGTAFIRIQNPVTNPTTQEDKGNDLVFRVIKEPLLQICINAGKSGEQILQKVIKEKGNVGYNAKTDKIEDLLESGIIDAVKVLRCELQNAASAAGNILISEAVIADTTN